jgi:hypothetical protein
MPPSYQYSLPQNARQVIETSLNCSESTRGCRPSHPSGCPDLALSGHTETIVCLSAFRAKRTCIDVRLRSPQSLMDPGCVKTHTSAKCRKHNSPARHRTSRVQYDLTLRDAIARRYFYVWRDRWSFRTAKTQSRHRPDRNPAMQRSPAVLRRAVFRPFRALE